jgi:hypothetical protein
MDFAFLARVSPQASLVEALDAISPRTSAVVVAGRDPYLVTAKDIMAKCNEVADNGGRSEATPVFTVGRKGLRIHARRKPPGSYTVGGMAGIVEHFESAFRAIRA